MYENPQKLLITKMSMLLNIEKIEIAIYNKKCISIVERIIKQCRDKIKWYDVCFGCMIDEEFANSMNDDDSMSELSLPNAQHINHNV